MPNPLPIASILMISCLGAAPAFADTPTAWNGATANWSTAADWSTNPVIPNNNAGSLYDVSLTAGSIALDINPTIQQLTWSTGTLTTGNLTVNGGITLNGVSDFLGSTAGAASLTNAAGQTATLGAAGTSFLQLANASTFNNKGTFTAIAGGVFNNGGGGTFNNTGTFNANLPSTGAFFNTGNGIAFNNAGTANILNGTLVLGGDAGNTTGAFQISATGALNLNGNFTFASTATIAGAGFLNFVTGTSTFKGAAPISVPTFNFAGGTITAPSALTLSSNITWSGGTFASAPITLSGNVAIAGGQSVYVSAANLTLGPGADTLGATGNVTLNLQNAGTINNTAALTASSGNIANNGNGGGTFNNKATFLCNVPANTTFSVAAGVPFNNSGTVTLLSGTLALNGGDTGATAGAFTLAANTTLSFGGNFTLTPAATITGNGTLDIAAGTTTIPRGLTQLRAVSIEGTLQNTANGSTAGTSLLSTLTLAGTTNAWTAKLNLATNKLILEATTATKSTALATLQNQVNFGKTHGLGIFASSLPANQGLAIADNAALSAPRTSFGGLAVDANSLLVSPELLGDTDLSGKVDLNDLNTVLNHLGTTTPFWTNGNFDGAATIDLNDLNFVLNNLGLSLTAGTNVAIATPEPASLGTLLIASLLLRRRRRTEHPCVPCPVGQGPRWA